MLATVTNILVVGIWIILGLGILAYAVYITFFPLIRTMGGGLLALKQYRKDTATAPGIIPNAQLGLTMADGGDSITGETGGENGV